MQKFKRNEDSIVSKSDVEIVEAGIITRVELLPFGSATTRALIEIDGGQKLWASADYVRQRPEVGGYHVIHPDSHESFMPAATFTRNYTAIAADYPIREESLNTGQQQIEGYRSLNEIALINKIKAHGRDTEKLLGLVRDHLLQQSALADNAEKRRIDTADPAKWLESARTSYQMAQMVLTRTVAQPTTF